MWRALNHIQRCHSKLFFRNRKRNLADVLPERAQSEATVARKQTPRWEETSSRLSCSGWFGVKKKKKIETTQRWRQRQSGRRSRLSHRESLYKIIDWTKTAFFTTTCGYNWANAEKSSFSLEWLPVLQTEHTVGLRQTPASCREPTFASQETPLFGRWCWIKSLQKRKK